MLAEGRAEGGRKEGYPKPTPMNDGGEGEECDGAAARAGKNGQEKVNISSREQHIEWEKRMDAERRGKPSASIYIQAGV